MRLALLPLDERPVNTSLPAAVAAIAGTGLELPPPAALPAFRTPGDPDRLAAWLADVGGHAGTAGVVVCLDTLGYGGLIPSRTTTDPIGTVLRRLGALTELRRRRPGLPIAAVSLVMRASDSYSGDEEPDYWPEHGRELHRLGAVLHRRHTGVAGADAEFAELARSLPDHVRADFLTRRLRNHTVNLAALELASTGVVGPLLITADDTAVHSAGSIEQLWLGYWIDALSPNVLMHPGADEVGAVLVAAALARASGKPVRFTVSCAEPDGLARIAPYENNAVGRTVAHQIRAADAEVSETSGDVVLVVHAPAPGGGDWIRARPTTHDADNARRTAELVAAALDGGASVALADVRYANGSDPALVERLLADGTLSRLVAYGGWNTAANTVGSVVAAATAVVAGRRLGTLDERAARRLLAHRIIEDYGYQAVVRPRLTADLPVRQERPYIPAERAEAYIADAGRLLQDIADRFAPTGPDGAGWRVGGLRLPWNRSFEIDFTLQRASDPATTRS